MVDERMCCACGKRNDRHQPAPGTHTTQINEGAVLICAYCGSLTIATETGSRHPTDEEKATILADEGVRSAWRFVNERLAPKLNRRRN